MEQLKIKLEAQARINAEEKLESAVEEARSLRAERDALAAALKKGQLDPITGKGIVKLEREARVQARIKAEHARVNLEAAVEEARALRAERDALAAALEKQERVRQSGILLAATPSDAAHIFAQTRPGVIVTSHSDPGCMNLCMCNGYVPDQTKEAILTSDITGTFEDLGCSSIRIHLKGCCADDCLCGCCCCCGFLPCCPIWACRDCWCRGCCCDCQKTNTFSLTYGHFYTFIDKDTFVYHWMCCPECARYQRAPMSSGDPTVNAEMERYPDARRARKEGARTTPAP